MNDLTWSHQKISKQEHRIFATFPSLKCKLTVFISPASPKGWTSLIQWEKQPDLTKQDLTYVKFDLLFALLSSIQQENRTLFNMLCSVAFLPYYEFLTSRNKQRYLEGFSFNCETFTEEKMVYTLVYRLVDDLYFTHSELTYTAYKDGRITMEEKPISKYHQYRTFYKGKNIPEWFIDDHIPYDLLEKEPIFQRMPSNTCELLSIIPTLKSSSFSFNIHSLDKTYDDIVYNLTIKELPGYTISLLVLESKEFYMDFVFKGKDFASVTLPCSDYPELFNAAKHYITKKSKYRVSFLFD